MIAESPTPIDKEEDFAYDMLIGDLNQVRGKIAKCMLECISGKVEVEKTFTVERAFFM